MKSQVIIILIMIKISMLMKAPKINIRKSQNIEEMMKKENENIKKAKERYE